MELGEPDESGRRCCLPLEGCEEEIPCDLVVVALGTLPNPLLTSATPEIGLNKSKNICFDDRQATSMDKVFAGGDIVRGNATVILAMGHGKNAARAIAEYLKQKKEAGARSPSMAFSRR